MNLSKRNRIEQLLNDGKSITEIAEEINKSRNTIYYEIKKHRQFIKCNRYGVSPSYNLNCDKTNKNPFVCNSCPSRKSFFSSLLFLLNLTMQIRYTKPGTQDDCDYILSPIQYAKKSFFDSRFAQNNEPKNADANGAYNIALKGLKLICSIKDGALPKQEKGTERKEWFEFVQKKLYLDKD